jgi:F-type H+-transporting ATPase subunit b
MHLDWWTIGLQTINFGILVWLLHRFLYKPVLGIIDARKVEVRRQFDAAKDLEEKAKARIVALDAERAGIAAEREAALKAAAAQAQDMVEARRAQTAHDAQALIDSTRKTLAAEREQVLDEARRLALDLGADFAQRLLAEIPTQYRAEAWGDARTAPPDAGVDRAHRAASENATTERMQCIGAPAFQWQGAHRGDRLRASPGYSRALERAFVPVAWRLRQHHV